MKKRDQRHLSLAPKQAPKAGVPILAEFYVEEAEFDDFSKATQLDSGLVVPHIRRRRVMVDLLRVVGVSECMLPVKDRVELRLTAGGSQFVSNPFDEVVAAWASATNAMAIEMNRQINPNGHDGEDMAGRGSPDNTPPPAGADLEHPLPDEDLS